MDKDELKKLGQKIHDSTATEEEQKMFIRTIGEMFKEMNQILEGVS